MPTTNSPKQDIVPVRVTPVMRRQIDELVQAGHGNANEVIRTAVQQIYKEKIQTVNTYTFSVYGDGEGHGFKVIAANSDGRYTQSVVEDSGAVYETMEDAAYVAKAAVAKHYYNDWQASVKENPEYQEFRNRSAAAID